MKRVSVWIVVLCLLVFGGILIWVDNPMLSVKTHAERVSLQVWLLAICLVVLLLESLGVLANRKLGTVDLIARMQKKAGEKVSRPTRDRTEANKIMCYLRNHYGPLWRQKARLYLIVGEPAQIAAIAPGLAADHWLEGQGTVLLYGGSLQADADQALRSRWQALCRWRGLDGVVWALDKAQSADAAAMARGVRAVRALSRELRWQLPLHLWQVCDSEWSQEGRTLQPVGCQLPAGVTAEQLQQSLDDLCEPLRREGLAQMQADPTHDFLLRLSRDLQAEGSQRWRQALAPLLGVLARGAPLRGLWFSLPVAAGAQPGQNLWLMNPAWEGVLGDTGLRRRRVGWGAPRVGYVAVLVVTLVWGAGLVLSFASNRAYIAQVQASLVALEQSIGVDEQLYALNELARELARLEYRAVAGAPWYQRLGLNHNDALLAALWPRYIEANQRLLRDPAAALLRRQLQALVRLAPDSPERARRAQAGYEQLKAYLMMARPERGDAAFLARVLEASEAVPGALPSLWLFYAEHLAAQPPITLDPVLVAQARQVLLGQLGQRNADATVYQQVIEAAASHYPALGLHDMVGDTDAALLFSSKAQVPGVFTRQAWEGQVRQAIEDIAQARREEIDWVLSDHHNDVAEQLSPQELKARLTERYFQDYSNAWLGFLNSLRWQHARSLADVIDQLTLMSDVRQSALIALMNTVAYHGQAGARSQALGESLIQSAQKLIAKDALPLIDQQVQGPVGPLDATFGPLLTLLGRNAEGQGGEDSLSLQTFLTRVTRVRLKLQQVSNAADPREMTQALAQTVFQGKSVDLTDTQSYGSLIAASLGGEWGGVGHTLFVQPLEQAWQRVLQPSAASLNSQWQRAIVSHWQGAFDGRYPFADTANDASLPMLGQMIRADSGRIEQFLQRELGGVLRKEGNRWVVDPQHSQGLRFNPEFLAAVNQLSHLADVLYTDGGMGLGFELQGKAMREVVQTTFTLNGERHHYFNQRERWQRFTWPGGHDHPGARLTWTSVRSGERMFGDYQGNWGLIRLLENARVTPLDDGESRYRLEIEAPDGLNLTWHLRTELGAGPLALLTLRGFSLPAQIFLSGAGKDVAYAQNRSTE
ncbi:hypothetical protein D3C77_149210 [compost metagenome]